MNQKTIDAKAKGFDMIHRDHQLTIEDLDEDGLLDFSKMRVGVRSITDAILNVGTFKKVNKNYGDKEFILRAIYRKDYETLREISKYFYESSGIYYRLCRYLAFLYRYDWFVTPYVNDINKVNENKVLGDFSKVLTYMDKSNVKKMLGDMALEIIKTGVYYGIAVDFGDRFGVQQLPSNYCRSRYFCGTTPVVELNMQFFDSYFANVQYRLKVLQMFPKEVQKGYVLFKQGKLAGDYPGDKKGWFALDPETCIKFSLNDSEIPPLVGVIPSIIDLDEAQELDRKKTMQQLLKIIVQKLPLDKNGDLIFDVDEAMTIHDNAVAMLKRAVGIDVLTTFADIEKIDTRDTNSTTTQDDLEKVERTVFNNSGISQNLFNSDGNLAVTNSILNDESSVRDMIFQFQSFLNRMVSKFDRKNHYTFGVSILETTQYNYKELSKMYKEHVQIGYSKMLPQVALGHSQSSIIAMAQFENEMLHLSEIMLPPLSSNTINGEDLMGKKNQTQQSNSQKQQTTEKNSSGRPEKADAEKSDKTIANRQSMS